jgi:hypothetical protein
MEDATRYRQIDGRDLSEPKKETQTTTPRGSSFFHRGWWTIAFGLGVLAWAAFLTNVCFAIWTTVKMNPSTRIATLSHGDCKASKKGFIASHVIINILSSALLGGSNYCMQRLSAPSRDNIDRAHSKGKWLDIGVSSFRNLWFIPRKCAIMWWLLACSSIPLHLLSVT